MTDADDFLQDKEDIGIKPDEERSDAEYIGNLMHPYARYGYAVALTIGTHSDEPRDEADLRNALINALEEGLETFRMEPEGDPALSDGVSYAAIRFAELERDPGLVQGQLSQFGKYLFPSIVSTDGTARDTFDQTVALVQRLRKNDKLTANAEFKRSYAPTVSKINNGSPSQGVPRGTLLEAACSAVTTVTPRKASALVVERNGVGRNTVIIPDLPSVTGLCRFIDVFQRMSNTATDNLMLSNRQAKVVEAASSNSKPKRQGKLPAAPKSEFRRPKIFSGNYPYAPRNPEYFGAAGMLAAIGQWANEAEENAWALPVLSLLAERPLYIISYDAIHQEQFDHRVVRMARNGKLHLLIAALAMKTRVTAEELDTNRINYDSSQRKLFNLMSSRFLQLFSKPAFRDFVAMRTQYPHELDLLFKEYFMDRQPVDPELSEIVSSAAAYGRWLNTAAYHAAREETNNSAPQEKNALLRKEKSKILTLFESAAMSAKSGQAMIAQVSTQAGRLSQGEAFPEAQRFIKATVSGEILHEDAKNLLMVYLRLQSPVERKDSADKTVLEGNQDDTMNDTEGITEDGN